MTTENNKIIAEFMIKQEPTENFCVGSIGQEVGVFTGIKTEYFKYEDLKFHSDWNWLMEVVEKIESISFGEDNFINVTIGCGFNCTIQDAHGKLFKLSTWEHTKIKTVYNTCLEFIKYYNEQNKV